MLELRPFDSLGHADHGWLDARHHFSFARYHDAARMGWGALRVWNDDRIAAGAGFPAHPHAQMEIITYVRQGAISHRDSMGNHGRTGAVDVQVMSAGSGVQHSEYNEGHEPVELFQIWIHPEDGLGPPAWGTKVFPKADRSGKLVVLASGLDEDRDALPIRAQARLLGATLHAGDRVVYTFYDQGARKGYLVPARGRVRVGDVEVNARDGLAVSQENHLMIEALEDSEIVLVDVRG